MSQQKHLSSLAIKVKDHTVDISSFDDTYLDEIADSYRRNLADLHYDLCLEYGMGYIGPQWHFRHYGEVIINATIDEGERLWRTCMESNCRSILVHLLSLTMGSPDYKDVLSEPQMIVRDRIVRVFALGVQGKCPHFDKAAVGFCSRPLGEDDLSFLRYMGFCNYRWMTDLALEDWNYHWMVGTEYEDWCITSSHELVLDQFVFDIWRLWRRNGRRAFAYDPELTRKYHMEW